MTELTCGVKGVYTQVCVKPLMGQDGAEWKRNLGSFQNLGFPLIPCPGLLWSFSDDESACQYRGHGFDPWSGKIPQCLRATKPVCHSY